MHPRFAQLSVDLSSSIEGLRPEELSYKHDAHWSIAEILEHLYLSYTGTIKGFERCLQAGRSLALAPTPYHRCAAFLVTGLGYFPKGRPAPKQTIPKGLAVERVIADLPSAMAAMDEVATNCERKFGRSIRVLDHPILGPLTIEQWRKFHLVHGRHHLRQIVERRRQLEKRKGTG